MIEESNDEVALILDDATSSSDESDDVSSEVESKVTTTTELKFIISVEDNSVVPQEPQQQDETISILPAVHNDGDASSGPTMETNSIVQDDATIPNNDSQPDALMELVRNAFTVMGSPHHNTDSSVNGIQGEENHSIPSPSDVWGVAYNFFGIQRDEPLPLLSTAPDHEKEEEVIKCTSYNPSPTVRPTAVRSVASMSEPSSTGEDDVVQASTSMPFKSSAIPPSGNDVTQASSPDEAISIDSTVLEKNDPSPNTKKARPNLVIDTKTAPRFNCDGIPLTLSPKKIWRARDSGFEPTPATVVVEATSSIPIVETKNKNKNNPTVSGSVNVDRTAAKDNKVRKDLAQTNNITTEIPTSDDNELQKDQQEQTNTEITHEVSAHDGSTDIESVLKFVTVDRVKEENKKSIKENSPSKSQVEKNPKHIDDEPPKRIVSPRYRKTDFLKFKNRLRRKVSREKQQRKKSNKSPQKQRQDGNNKSHEKEQIPHTKESPTTHRPGSQSPLKQRRFIKSPTKQRPRSKELVVSTDFDYDKNSKTSATKTPTTTAKDGAAVPSAKTKSKTKDSGALKAKMSATKTIKSFSKTKTTRTQTTTTTVEDRNDSELSSKDRDQFYDAIAS